MDTNSPVLVILPEGSDRSFYGKVVESAGYSFANFFDGTPLQAADSLAQTGYSPKYLIIDIGDLGADAIAQIDKLAEYCESGCRVVVLGHTNDITFYRHVLSRGVSEYFTHPAQVDAVRSVLFANVGEQGGGDGKIIAFVGSSAGDGSSTIATNVAYQLSQQGSTVLVDLDYQYGMIAKNLDVTSEYGIKDIFDHPDRGVDATLVERMAVPYNDKLSIISAPNSLGFIPKVSPETMRDLAVALKQKYDYVVFDLPHLWDRWAAAALTASDRVVLVSQLWLKSVTHASRLINTWKSTGISPDKVSIVVNRSGAKFKEAVNPKDFERVLMHKISHYVANDIKTVVQAENEGKTVMELGNGQVANQLLQLSNDISGLLGDGSEDGSSPLMSRLRLTRK